MDQNSIEYQAAEASFKKLAAQIPELNVESSRPSMQDHMHKQLKQEVDKVVQR